MQGDNQHEPGLPAARLAAGERMECELLMIYGVAGIRGNCPMGYCFLPLFVEPLLTCLGRITRGNRELSRRFADLSRLGMLARPFPGL